MGSLTSYFHTFLGFLGHWASACWAAMLELSPFLIMGFLAAGVLHVLVPGRIILWALSKKGWRGAARGALMGVPLPLCSCSVVPTSISLRREGASLSSTLAFTISTPETSIDALVITFVMMPPIFLGLRPAAALTLAIVVGALVEKFTQSNAKLALSEDLSKLHALGDVRSSQPLSAVCRICGLREAKSDGHQHGAWSRLTAVFKYAFGVFFEDIIFWILFGVAIAGFFQVLIPPQGLASGWWKEHYNLQVFAATVAGIPLYSCATSSTALAAVLLQKGVSPGAALALLLTGPATNISTYLAFKKEFGGTVAGFYHGLLITLCCVFGVLVNELWPFFESTPLSKWMSFPDASNSHWGAMFSLPHSLEIVSVWVLIVLALRLLWKRYGRSSGSDDCCDTDGGHDHGHGDGHDHDGHHHGHAH